MSLSCANKSTTRPANAPNLVPGVWTDISPSGSGLSFGRGNLTQGMALDPCDAATLYLAVCADGGSAAFPKGVFRTTDGGSSWTRILATDSPNHIRVNPADPLQIYVSDGVAGSTNGFWRTRDGGKNWQRITSMCDVAGVTSSCGMGDLYDVAFDPTDFSHVLISFHSPWDWSGAKYVGAGILESKDGGDTWIPHHPGANWGYGHSVKFLYRPEDGVGDANTWLVGTQTNGMFRTADGGKTWSQSSPAPISHGGSGIYYATDGKTLYSSAVNGLLRSTDNGAHFQLIATGFPSLAVVGDGTTLYAGNDSVMVASESDLTHWTIPPNPPTLRYGGGPFELAYDPVNHIVYSANNQNGLWALKVR